MVNPGWEWQTELNYWESVAQSYQFADPQARFSVRNVVGRRIEVSGTELAQFITDCADDVSLLHQLNLDEFNDLIAVECAGARILPPEQLYTYLRPDGWSPPPVKEQAQ